MLVGIEDFPQGEEHFPGCPTVKPPFTLFQVQMEGLFGDAVELSQVAFCLVPEVLDAIDVIPFRGGECLGMIDAHMMIPLNMEAVVAAEGITVDDAVRCHTFLDNGN